MSSPGMKISGPRTRLPPGVTLHVSRPLTDVSVLGNMHAAWIAGKAVFTLDGLHVTPELAQQYGMRRQCLISHHVLNGLVINDLDITQDEATAITSGADPHATLLGYRLVVVPWQPEES